MNREWKLERKVYYGGRFLTQVSQNLLFAGLFLFAGGADHAGVGVGNLFVAMLIPAVALGMFGGAVADRLGPARGYALGAFLRFVPALVGVFILDGAMTAWAVAFLYSAGSQVFSPAEMAMVKVVDADRPGRTHAFIIALQAVAQGVGIVILAPAFYFIGGPRLIITGAAVGYALLTFVGLWMTARQSALAPSAREVNAFSFRETIAFFRAHASARDAVGAQTLRVLTTRAITVAFPLYLAHDMGLSREWTIYLLIPAVIGALIGLAWTSRHMTLARAPAGMRLAVAGFGVGTAALAVFDYTLRGAVNYSHIPPLLTLETHLNTTFIVALPAAFLIGLSLMLATVSSRVVLTEAAPMNQQSRVFAAQLWLSEALIILPLAFTGLGTDFAGARSTLGGVAFFAFLTLLVMDFGKLRARLPRRVAEAPVAA